MTNHTIRECLDTLKATALGDYATVLLQFQYIKKCYRTKILATHPDKGGDPAVFRQVQTSFEVLRELHATGAIGDSFETAAQNDVEADDYYAQCWEDFGSTTFSWEYYYAATETVEPGYRIELAKSGRSKCKKKSNQKGCQHGNQPGDEIIEKDSIRVGSLVEETGSYGRWFHLVCWRVPSKVWLGLPQDEDLLQDEQAVLDALQKMNLVLLSGLEDLSDQDKLQVVHHVSNKENWAKLVKRKKPPKDAIILVEENEAEQGVAEPGNRTNKRKDIATARGEYIPPVPTPETKNNFAGKTFVLTGIFPEIGGGTGLSLGKARVKALIESFGGRVTGSISGKTDVLVVGKEPGYSKVGSRFPEHREQVCCFDP